MIDFSTLPLSINIAAFAAAAAFVWLGGSRLANYADAISSRTHLSQAMLGMVMLGIATSLPEMATTVTAAWLGNAALLAGNLFGGVAMQTAILAVVDLIAVRRRPLAYFTPQPVLLLQGVMLLLLLALAVAGAAAGEPLSMFGIGLTPVLILAGYILTVRWSQPATICLDGGQSTNPTNRSPAINETLLPTSEPSVVYLQRSECSGHSRRLLGTGTDR